MEWQERLPTLAGERLELRWLTSADAPDVFAVFGDPRVIRYWSTPALEDLSAARELIEEIHDLYAGRELFQWGLASRSTGRVLGTCTLFRVDLTHRRAEVGIALGADSWGQGLATEALELLIEFAFGPLDLHRLEADVDPNNQRSLALFERQGFQREGLLRERWQLHGEVQDTVMLGLLRREWEPRV